MADMDWKMVVANAVAGAIPVLAFAVAYWIRENANGRNRQKADEDRRRLEYKLDGTAAMTATSLVSSGRLPKTAPCPPEVARAINSADAKSADDYVSLAMAVAHDKMTQEGIPPQTQELLVDKLRTMIEETRQKEERHTQNNAMFFKMLKDEIERLKEKMAAKEVVQETLNPSETLKPLTGDGK